MVKGKFKLQSRDGLVQSYQDMKTTVKNELNGKEVISKTPFIKTWINDENIRKYDSMVFTPPPLKHDLRLGRDLKMRKRHYHLILIWKLMNIS
jgi:hypothetical protein